MYSRSEEKYLKTIYILSEENKKRVSTNDIADMLESKASSATDMIQKLSDKKLVKYEKYKGVLLTPKGLRTALEIVRKQRLWSTFLIQHLHFSWDEVGSIAEQMEHIKSPKLSDKLDAFLQYPQRDPYGNPIPDKSGKIPKTKSCLLSEIEAGEKGILLQIKDQDADFLSYLNSMYLKPGTEILVKQKYKYDQSIIAQIGRNELMLSERVTKNLLIIPSDTQH